VGTDPKTDIAVLRIESENLDYLEPGNSDDLQVGEIVMAVGSPMSASLAYTVTQGIVSAKGRANVGLADYEDFIQTDAAINPGNSGGPLVNLDGELVGINTAIVSRSGGFQGIGFAVPVNMATRVMNQLITTGRVVRGWLGVYIQDVSDNLADALSLDDPDGALVSEVVPGSPADEAGLEAGDVIIELDGQAVPNSAQLRNHVASTPPGTNVTMLVVREGHDKNITVKLGELPGDEPIAATSREDSFEDIAGFTVRTLDRESANRYDISQNLSGVIVTSIDPASNAFSAGLREGDLIIAIDRQQIESRSDFADAVSDAERGDKILLRVHRDGAGFFMAFTL
jgi:serine protease Do